MENAKGSNDGVAITPELLNEINIALGTADADYRVLMAEYITAAGSNEVGNTVLAKDVGNKQLAHDFVPNDPRRSGWSGPANGDTDNITYTIDQVDAVPPIGGLTGAETTAAILRATGTWDNLNCSDLPLTPVRSFGNDVGVIAFLNGLGGSPFIFADVQHAGWEINFAGGILGVTFTFVFIDGGGVPTDVDNNGKIDTAFREIYYDTSFSWADDGTTNIDVESVALHEIGHGLSQAHFGSVLIKKNGDLKRAPAAVMNALYSEPMRELLGTDGGGHCSNWAQWPNN